MGTCEYCLEEKNTIINEQGELICEECYMLWIEDDAQSPFDQDEIEIYEDSDYDIFM